MTAIAACRLRALRSNERMSGFGVESCHCVWATKSYPGLVAKIDLTLLVVGIFLSLFGAIILIDLFAALEAQACGRGKSSASCFPWGAEGPGAENWRYQSKSIYLASGFILAMTPLLTTASLFPSLTRGRSLSRAHRLLVVLAFASTLILAFS